MTKAFEKQIIKHMAGIIEVNYDDEKEGGGFNGQDFMKEMYGDEKCHFFQHPSTWVEKCCEGKNYEEQMNLFKILFKTAWNLFAKKVTQK